MITEIEDYFTKGCGRCARFATVDCTTQKWAAGILDLRQLCHDAGLIETLKWGHPCYMHAGRNIVIIGALLGDFRLNFFNAALLRDSEAVLEKQGPNTQHPDMIRFTDSTQVRAMAPTIAAYLREAMGYAAAGIKPTNAARAMEWPEELHDTLAADPELAEAFHRLTPGRQRGYIIHLNSAKSAATRLTRLIKARPRILDGRGINEA